MRLGIKKLYPDTIAHAFYYALKHELSLAMKEEELLEILTLDDCLTSVMLLQYAITHDLKVVEKAIRKRSAKLKSGNSIERDKQWLLIYQTWSENDLERNKQQFLAALKRKQFQFLAMPKRTTGNSTVKDSEFSGPNYSS